MKHVQASLSARKDGENSFLQCGSPVKLAQVCLSMRSIVQCSFHLRVGAVKHVQACFSSKKYVESRFHLCGSLVKLVKSGLCAGNILQRR